MPALTTAELEALLSDPTHEVILLDAREADEYAVSHLRGAHIATSDDDAVTVLEQLDAAARPEVVIVAYCSSVTGRRPSCNACTQEGSGTPSIWREQCLPGRTKTAPSIRATDE